MCSELNTSGSQLVELFPMPLLSYVWPNSEALNKKLSHIILSKEKADKGIQTTNIGGWHSKKNLQNWEEEPIKIILSRILALGQEMTKNIVGVKESELLNGWTIQSWANINRYGHFNKYHHHVRNFNLWSGVYYVDTGESEAEPAAGSRIVFADQHEVEVVGQEKFRRRFSIQPESALMLLFPSSLGHEVEPYYGQGSRITIAFNIKHPKFTTLNYEMIKTDELHSQTTVGQIKAQGT